MSEPVMHFTPSGDNGRMSPAWASGVGRVADYLYRAAERRELRLELHEERAVRHRDVITLPAALPNTERMGGVSLDDYEAAERLQDLEDEWNNQEPRPDVSLILEVAHE